MTSAIDEAGRSSRSYVHGRQACRACFGDPTTSWHSASVEEFEVRRHRWQLRPNPGYWGAAAPRILVLGFSKGPEQNGLIEEYLNGTGQRVRFEDIPFNDTKKQMRPNLKKLLVELGILDKRRSIDLLFEPTETVFGFASLIRCTVTYAKPGSTVFVGSGGGITARTLELNPTFVKTCIGVHLSKMPSSVRLLIILV